MKMTHILHDGEDLSGTSLGRLHLVAVLDVLDDVSEGDAGVGHAAEGVDLPQQDAEAPHVWLVGELGLSQSLRQNIVHQSFCYNSKQMQVAKNVNLARQKFV